MIKTPRTSMFSAALLSLSMFACGGGPDGFDREDWEGGRGPDGGGAYDDDGSFAAGGPGAKGGGEHGDHGDEGHGEHGDHGDEGGAAEATPASCDPTEFTCVVVGVYGLENGEYVDMGKELVFTVGAMCQSWSRWTQKADVHSDEGHLHYNAHRDSSYQNGVFTWYEYGPEASQEDIDDTCAEGVGGVKKSVTLDDYTPDKMIYLRIKSVSGPDMP